MNEEKKYVYTVISHDKEAKSDFLRGIYQKAETAQDKVDRIKKEYTELSGLDDFDEYYTVRLEKVEVE